jgi:hypothetical protein
MVDLAILAKNLPSYIQEKDDGWLDTLAPSRERQAIETFRNAN